MSLMLERLLQQRWIELQQLKGRFVVASWKLLMLTVRSREVVTRGSTNGVANAKGAVNLSYVLACGMNIVRTNLLSTQQLSKVVFGGYSRERIQHTLCERSRGRAATLMLSSGER